VRQALATEIMEHEYDHVAFFVAKLATMGVTINCPDVRLPLTCAHMSRSLGCLPVLRCPPSKTPQTRRRTCHPRSRRACFLLIQVMRVTRYETIVTTLCFSDATPSHQKNRHWVCALLVWYTLLHGIWPQATGQMM